VKAMRKELILKENKYVWSIQIKVTHPTRPDLKTYTDEIATFAKRPMALCAMASAFNSISKWMMVDSMTIIASAEGVDALKSVEIYTPECDVIAENVMAGGV